MDAILKKIRTDLRLSMNGVVSTSMREKGLNYGLNFGVSIPKLRQIAKKYKPNVSLAETLYKQDTRELKILATMLYPVEHLSDKTADEWCRLISNQEIREQACMNLFQNSANAVCLAQRWVEHPDENIRTTGYWLLARLFLTRKDDMELKQLKMDDILLKSAKDIRSESAFLQRAALNVFKFYGRTSKKRADFVLELLKMYEKSENSVEREIYEILSFEFSLLD